MKIMENESLWAGMSQASLQYATRFDWNTIFTNVIEGVLFTSKGE
jgi:hypothetical protein